MKTINVHNTEKSQSKGMLWTGRIMTYLCILFFLVDAVMKLVRESHHVEGTIKLGYPDYSVQVFGAVLLICTITYAIPRTAILGAILLTGYLGGATATMVRAGEPVYFPIVFGIIAWGGLFLRDAQLRALIPLRRRND